MTKRVQFTILFTLESNASIPFMEWQDADVQWIVDGSDNGNGLTLSPAFEASFSMPIIRLSFEKLSFEGVASKLEVMGILSARVPDNLTLLTFQVLVPGGKLMLFSPNNQITVAQPVDQEFPETYRIAV